MGSAHIVPINYDDTQIMIVGEKVVIVVPNPLTIHTKIDPSDNAHTISLSTVLLKRNHKIPLAIYMILKTA